MGQFFLYFGRKIVDSLIQSLDILLQLLIHGYLVLVKLNDFPSELFNRLTEFLIQLGIELTIVFVEGILIQH